MKNDFLFHHVHNYLPTLFTSEMPHSDNQFLLPFPTKTLYLQWARNQNQHTNQDTMKCQHIELKPFIFPPVCSAAKILFIIKTGW